MVQLFLPLSTSRECTSPTSFLTNPAIKQPPPDDNLDGTVTNTEDNSDSNYSAEVKEKKKRMLNLGVLIFSSSAWDFDVLDDSEVRTSP